MTRHDEPKISNSFRDLCTAYLALANISDCEFWTADEVLIDSLQGKLPWVRCIGKDYPAQELKKNLKNALGCYVVKST